MLICHANVNTATVRAIIETLTFAALVALAIKSTFSFIIDEVIATLMRNLR